MKLNTQEINSQIDDNQLNKTQLILSSSNENTSENFFLDKESCFNNLIQFELKKTDTEFNVIKIKAFRGGHGSFDSDLDVLMNQMSESKNRI